MGARRPWRAALALLAIVVAMAPGAPRVAADAPPGRYEATADTVRDVWTGLVWQRAVPAETFTWDGAKTYCAGLMLSGQAGWRLPAVKELRTLVDERAANPAIDAAAFPGTPVDYFWSSSPYAFNAAYAWVVFFYYGYTSYSTLSYYYRVRCVR